MTSTHWTKQIHWKETYYTSATNPAKENFKVIEKLFGITQNCVNVTNFINNSSLQRKNNYGTQLGWWTVVHM